MSCILVVNISNTNSVMEEYPIILWTLDSMCYSIHNTPNQNTSQEFMSPLFTS